MTKRSFILIAALGLLASLTLVTPSHAASVPYTYTATVSGASSITGTFVAGTTVSPPPKLTLTGVSNTPPSPTAPVNPILGSGSAYAITIGSYTTTHIPASPTSSLYSINGTLTEDVAIKVGGNSIGQFVISETFTGIVGYFGGVSYTTITPAISATSAPGPFFYQGKEYQLAVFYEATSTETNVPGSAVQIAIQAVPVPEPTSMALLGLGMTSFLAFRRIFKRTPLA